MKLIDNIINLSFEIIGRNTKSIAIFLFGYSFEYDEDYFK